MTHKLDDKLGKSLVHFGNSHDKVLPSVKVSERVLTMFKAKNL